MKAVVLRAPGDVGVEEIADPAILEPGDEAILPNPCYPAYPHFVEAARGKPVWAGTAARNFTYTADLARVIIRLCRADARGIVHATNRDNCSWFEFAREIIADARLSATVRPTPSDHFVRPAQRPKYSVLSSKSLEKYGIEMPNWQDAVRRYLQDRN